MIARSRIAWRCRRGTRELDLLLQDYLASAFDGAPEDERQLFCQLLDLPDQRIEELLLGSCSEVSPEMHQLAAKIRSRNPS